jgi:hypothetical protein
MFEIMLTIGGVILGALLTVGYERFKEQRSVRHVRVLLSQEIDMIIPGLKEIIEILEAFPANELPQYIKPMNIEEIAQRVETACHRESFEACRPNLPVLGKEVMGAVFEFYKDCQEVPRSFREIERWAGNIRHGLFQDYINELIDKAKNLRTKLVAYRDGEEPHSSPPPPHHAAYGSVLRDSADQAESDPGEQKPK